MADITAYTLKIGSDNLILRDADAQAKIATNTQDISSLKEDLTAVESDALCTTNIIKIATSMLSNGTWAGRKIIANNQRLCTTNLIPVHIGDIIEIIPQSGNDLLYAYGFYVGSNTSSSGYTDWQTGGGKFVVLYNGNLFIQFKTIPDRTITANDDYKYDITINTNPVYNPSEREKIAQAVWAKELYRYPINMFSSSYRIQGICYNSDDNIYYVCGGHRSKNGNTRIYVTPDMTLNSDSAYYDIVCGHANDCTYNPDDGFLYIVSGADENNQAEGPNPKNSVIKVNTSTMVVDSVIILSGQDVAHAIDYYDGKFYVAEDVYTYVYDSSFSLLQKLSTPKEPINRRSNGLTLTRQGLIVNDSYIIRNGVISNSDLYNVGGFFAIYDKNGYLIDVLFYDSNIRDEQEGLVERNGKIYVITDRNYYVINEFDYKKNKLPFNQTSILLSGDDLNNKMAFGRYASASGTITNSLSNKPSDLSVGFTMEVEFQSTNNIRQTIYPNQASYYYRRVFENAFLRWNSWAKFTGAIVT